MINIVKSSSLNAIYCMYACCSRVARPLQHPLFLAPVNAYGDDPPQHVQKKKHAAILVPKCWAMIEVIHSTTPPEIGGRCKVLASRPTRLAVWLFFRYTQQHDETKGSWSLKVFLKLHRERKAKMWLELPVLCRLSTIPNNCQSRMHCETSHLC